MASPSAQATPSHPPPMPLPKAPSFTGWGHSAAEVRSLLEGRIINPQSNPSTLWQIYGDLPLSHGNSALSSFISQAKRVTCYITGLTPIGISFRGVLQVEGEIDNMSPGKSPWQCWGQGGRAQDRHLRAFTCSLANLQLSPNARGMASGGLTCTAPGTHMSSSPALPSHR